MAVHSFFWHWFVPQKMKTWQVPLLIKIYNKWRITFNNIYKLSWSTNKTNNRLLLYMRMIRNNSYSIQSKLIHFKKQNTTNKKCGTNAISYHNHTSCKMQIIRQYVEISWIILESLTFVKVNGIRLRTIHSNGVIYVWKREGKRNKTKYEHMPLITNRPNCLMWMCKLSKVIISTVKSDLKDTYTHSAFNEESSQ